MLTEVRGLVMRKVPLALEFHEAQPSPKPE